MKSYTMKPGRYVITDACQSKNYDDTILDGFYEFDRGDSGQFGETVLTCIGGDGCGLVRDMNNQEVGRWGADAANVSIIPAEDTGEVPNHYGTYVEFDSEFTVAVYHDAIVVGDRYRVRY